MRRAAKIDATQSAIRGALEQAGCTVQTIANVGNGVPDLLVGLRGKNVLIECKSKGGRMTDDQRDWHAWWDGSVHIAHTPEEALKAVGLL